ncbi:hypothetical protein JNW90_10575 [Micromonospora sp. STR1s_5]|nr:hypothetical protein [Micromonospora sp. STR1s_5]
MAGLLDGLARLLHADELGHYDPDGVYPPDVPAGTWPIHLEHQPPDPGQTITLFQQPGGEQPGNHGWAEPTVHLRVRGTEDARVSRDKAQELYDRLHGMTYTELPGGVYVVDCLGQQSGPRPAGADANGLHQHITTVRVSIEHPV